MDRNELFIILATAGRENSEKRTKAWGKVPKQAKYSKDAIKMYSIMGYYRGVTDNSGSIAYNEGLEHA